MKNINLNQIRQNLPRYAARNDTAREQFVVFMQSLLSGQLDVSEKALRALDEMYPTSLDFLLSDGRFYNASPNSKAFKNTSFKPLFTIDNDMPANVWIESHMPEDEAFLLLKNELENELVFAPQRMREKATLVAWAVKPELAVLTVLTAYGVLHHEPISNWGDVMLKPTVGATRALDNPVVNRFLATLPANEKSQALYELTFSLNEKTPAWERLINGSELPDDTNPYEKKFYDFSASLRRVATNHDYESGWNDDKKRKTILQNLPYPNSVVAKELQNAKSIADAQTIVKKFIVNVESMSLVTLSALKRYAELFNMPEQEMLSSALRKVSIAEFKQYDGLLRGVTERATGVPYVLYENPKSETRLLIPPFGLQSVSSKSTTVLQPEMTKSGIEQKLVCRAFLTSDLYPSLKKAGFKLSQLKSNELLTWLKTLDENVTEVAVADSLINCYASDIHWEHQALPTSESGHIAEVAGEKLTESEVEEWCNDEKHLDGTIPKLTLLANTNAKAWLEKKTKLIHFNAPLVSTVEVQEMLDGEAVFKQVRHGAFVKNEPSMKKVMVTRSAENANSLKALIQLFNWKMQDHYGWEAQSLSNVPWRILTDIDAMLSRSRVERIEVPFNLALAIWQSRFEDTPLLANVLSANQFCLSQDERLFMAMKFQDNYENNPIDILASLSKEYGVQILPMFDLNKANYRKSVRPLLFSLTYENERLPFSLALTYGVEQSENWFSLQMMVGNETANSFLRKGNTVDDWFALIVGESSLKDFQFNSFADELSFYNKTGMANTFNIEAKGSQEENENSLLSFLANVAKSNPFKLPLTEKSLVPFFEQICLALQYPNQQTDLLCDDDLKAYVKENGLNAFSAMSTVSNRVEFTELETVCYHAKLQMANRVVLDAITAIENRGVYLPVSLTRTLRAVKCPDVSWMGLADLMKVIRLTENDVNERILALQNRMTISDYQKVKVAYFQYTEQSKTVGGKPKTLADWVRGNRITLNLSSASQHLYNAKISYDIPEVQHYDVEQMEDAPTSISEVIRNWDEIKKHRL